MEQIIDLTFKYLTQAIAVVIIVWEVYKHFKAIKKESDDEHTRRMGWDHASKVIAEKEDKWDDALMNMEAGRKAITERFDARLDEVDSRIEEYHTDEEAKIQELRADILILTRCMSAVLDGLKQLNCNGQVTEAKKNLDEFLMTKAYDL